MLRHIEEKLIFSSPREFRLLLRPLRLLGLLGLMGLVGCSEESEQENRPTVTFEAQSSATAFEQEDDHAESRPFGWTTRGWTPPSGYYLYDDPSDNVDNNNDIYSLFKEQNNLFYKSIDVFFTRDGKEPMHGTFSYKTSESKWRLDMDIEETGAYYVYGYIPKEVADNAIISGNSSFSEGAKLTISGINSITHSDVCVIVGAKDGTNENTATSSTGEILKTGDFKVNAQRAQVGSNNTDSHNYIYLLFDHLYSALAFNFKIDPVYNALRTIKVRKLELIGYNDDETKIKARYNVEVKLKGNSAGVSPIEQVTFEPDPTSGDLSFEPIYEANDDGIELDPDTPTAFLGCFVPGQNTKFILRTTYDVYDKNNGGNLIRYGCEAENVINLYGLFNIVGSLRGQMFKVTIKVIPTYLYVLSEPDMDNPTLKIE